MRLILEIVLFWSSFQIRLGQSPEIFQNYLIDYPDMKKDEYVYFKNYLRNDYISRFKERIMMKHETGKPSFGELVNELNKLKFNNLNFKDLQDNINFLHKALSGLMHISEKTLEEFDSGDLRVDFSFFQSYKFIQSRFDDVLTAIWYVLDILLTVMILTKTYFYRYESPSKLIESEITYNGSDSFSMEFLNDTKAMNKLKQFSYIIK